MSDIHYKGKKISVIASDFDGTILKHGMIKPSEQFIAQVKRLKEMGIFFVAASGRPYYNLQNIMAPVKDDIAFICENGAMVVEHGDIIFKNPFPAQLAEELLTDLDRLNSRDIMVSTPNSLYIYDDMPDFYHLLHDIVGNKVECVKNFNDILNTIIKISIHWSTGIPIPIQEKMRDKYGVVMQVVDGGNGWLDFTMNGSDKGAALRYLLERKNYPLEEVIAIGDSENDVQMLKVAGVSIAMNTASEFVKSFTQMEIELVESCMDELIIQNT